MRQNYRHQQRGITFLGLIVVGSIIGLAGLVAAQVFPTYLEYTAVQRAVNTAKTSSTVAEVRASFDKSASLEDIKSVTGKDLEITKEGDQVVISFAYEREIALFGPAYLTLKYEGRSN